jgi:hypothetical protein
MFLNKKPYAAYIRTELFNGQRFLVADMWCNRLILQSNILIDFMAELVEVMEMDLRKEIPHYFANHPVHLHPNLQGKEVNVSKEDIRALERILSKELEKFLAEFGEIVNK